MRIPNEEIRKEFAKTIRVVRRDETIRRVRESDQLIHDTVHMGALAGKRKHECMIGKHKK